MRVKCTDNAYQVLPTTSVYYNADSGDARFALQLGTDYIVYAIWIRGSEVLYSICEDEHASYPKWFPSVLFQVVDGQIPTCWQYGRNVGRNSKASDFLIAFPDWIADPSFNENLVDGDPVYREVWQRYKSQIATESTH